MVMIYFFSKKKEKERRTSSMVVLVKIKEELSNINAIAIADGNRNKCKGLKRTLFIGTRHSNIQIFDKNIFVK